MGGRPSLLYQTSYQTSSKEATTEHITPPMHSKGIVVKITLNDQRNVLMKIIVNKLEKGGTIW